MTTARQVPALVAAHADYLRGSAYHTYMANFLESMASTGNQTVDLHGQDADVAGAYWCGREVDLLRISHLFHVSESMTAVATVAAMQMHDTDDWNREAIPANTGARNPPSFVHSL